MSSSDLPEEGPVTTEHFLKKDPVSPASPVAATNPPIQAIDPKLLAADPNEQGRLAPWQQTQFLLDFLLQIPLIFAVLFVTLQIISTSSLGWRMFPVAVIISPLLMLLINSVLLVDLCRGKVLRVEGHLSQRKEGSFWTKHKRTIESIGDVDIVWPLGVFLFFRPTLSEKQRYVAYYFPMSKALVACYSPRAYREHFTPNAPTAHGPSRSAIAQTLVLEVIVVLFGLFLGSVDWSNAFKKNPPSYSAGPNGSNFTYATSRPYPTSTPPGPPPIAEKVTAGLLRTYSGHSRSVSSVEFSSDGKMILTGSFDNTAILWDAATGEKLQTLTTASVVNSVDFSPDNKVVLTGSLDNTTTLWDVNGHQLRTFTGQSGVTSVQFSPDGKTIFAGDWNGGSNLFDAVTGKLLHSFDRVNGAISGVAFSPDGKHIVIGSRDNTAILWDVTTDDKLRTFSGHTAAVSSVAFSPDGKWVLTGGRDRILILWNATTGEKLHTFSGHGAPVNAVAFSPDGRLILSGGDDLSAILWDVTTGAALRTYLGHGLAVNSVAFSPDGKTILTGSDDYTAKLWDISDLVVKAPAATP